MAKAKKSNAFIIVTLTVFLLSMLLFFTSLDNKLFDLFLRALPSLTENEKVYVLTLDDESIEFAGGWIPFRREDHADYVVLLKELGVESIVFDLSFLDASAQRFDEEYAAWVLNEYINLGYTDLNEALAYEIAPLLGRDVDEYFAEALAFSGNSWLTLTFTLLTDLYEGADASDIITDPETDAYIAEYIAPDFITAKNDTKTPEAIDVFPALNKLLSRARGAGFVNASPDKDGLRRRIHLLLKYHDNYYPQLTLASIKDKLGFSEIEVTNKKITLKNDDKTVLNIPRTQDGSVLLKWPKKKFDEYRSISLADLIRHNAIESALFKNLEYMDYLGCFSYIENDVSPLEYYLIADDIKKEAFWQNKEAEIDWIVARNIFFRKCDYFLNGDYEQRILNDIADYPEIAEEIMDAFDVCREQFNALVVIRNKLAELNGAFCIIGSSATSMIDQGLITFEENYPNVGSYYVLANMMLANEFINDTPWYISAVIALLFSMIIGYFVSRHETIYSIAFGVVGVFVLAGAFLGFFLITKIYIGFGVPLVCAVGTFLSLMIMQFLTASKDKAFLHSAFSRYLAPEIISEIINDPDKLNLGGEKRVMTAIFTDIQAFSTISEQLEPTSLVRLLNRYLTTMSNIIMENFGTVDKYEGDAIIAFFGAPVYRDDHAILACRSAIAMKKAEIEFNKLVEEENLSPIPIFTRIGINTGEMVVGNMGAENKMDYTIMGNAVNLAARLEGVNKQYRTGGILISEYTKAIVGNEFLMRRLDRVRVVGINTPLRLYELLNYFEKVDKKEIESVMQWEAAMDLYEAKQFTKALEIFKSIFLANADDRVAGLYCGRCEALIKDPPPENWDAVRNLTEK